MSSKAQYIKFLSLILTHNYLTLKLKLYRYLFKVIGMRVSYKLRYSIRKLKQFQQTMMLLSISFTNKHYQQSIYFTKTTFAIKLKHEIRGLV